MATDSKIVGRMQMTPHERYVVEIDWADELIDAQEIVVDLTELVEMPRRVDVSDRCLEGPTVVVGTLTVTVVLDLSRGRQYELAVVVTPTAGLVAASTQERRVVIDCV